MIKEYKLKNGEVRYLYYAYIGISDTGERQKLRKRGFKSKREAQIAEARAIARVDKYGFHNEKKDFSFYEMYEQWLENVYTNTVKESTLANTIGIFENHILPSFGKRSIKTITVNQCQLEVNKWSENFKEFKRFKNYASNIFDYAETQEVIKSNPMKKIILPVIHDEAGEDDDTENFYSKRELNQFLELMKQDHSLKWYAFFRMVAYTGMRKGEALALTWKDIDFDNHVITINKTLTRGLKNRLIIQSTKTKDGRRKISIDSFTINILKKWKIKQAELMLTRGINSNKPTQLVFSKINGDYTNPQRPYQKLQSVIKSHNLSPINVHGFRHTHCSILFEAGATLKEVQERLGHRDIHTTMNIYAHVTKERKKETADLFAKHMENE